MGKPSCMKINRNFYIRKTCRLCNSSKLLRVLPLRPSPLCDAYLKKPKEQQTYPLNLNLCQVCNFVQIDSVVDPKIIYKDYIYLTTSSQNLKPHFKKYAHQVCKNIGLKNPNFVVDIGSNDGTLLRCFAKMGSKVLGIEPSIRTARAASQSGIPTLPYFFDARVAKKIVARHGTPDLITVNNLFANIDNLQEFSKALLSLMEKNQFWSSNLLGFRT